MNLPLDDRIDQLHRQLEAKERDALQVEQRLQRLDLPRGSVKGRSYGELLGLPVPRPNYEQQAAAEARQQQIERMQRETDATRQRNQQAAQNRYQSSLAGVNANTGRRWA